PELKVDDFVAENVSDKDLAEKYGLETGKPATLRIAVKRSTGTVLGEDKTKPTAFDALLIGKKVPSAKPKEQAELLPQPKVTEEKETKEKDGKEKPKGGEAKDGEAKDKPKEKPKDGEGKDKPEAKDGAELLPQPKVVEVAEPELPGEDKYYARLES